MEAVFSILLSILTIFSQKKGKYDRQWNVVNNKKEDKTRNVFFE
jgi:hypothetical protein